MHGANNILRAYVGEYALRKITEKVLGEEAFKYKRIEICLEERTQMKMGSGEIEATSLLRTLEKDVLKSTCRMNYSADSIGLPCKGFLFERTELLDKNDKNAMKVFNEIARLKREKYVII